MSAQRIYKWEADMSNFNDLYEHFAQDSARKLQFLGVQDIRRKAIAELMAAGAYTEPEEENLTDGERAARRAEAACALGAQLVMEASKLPSQGGDEAFAMAIRASAALPYCTVLCMVQELEEQLASGAVERSQSGLPFFFVIAAYAPGEDLSGLNAAVDMLRAAYPQFRIAMDAQLITENNSVSDQVRELRAAMDACKTAPSQESLQRLAEALLETPLVFPAQRDPNAPEPKPGAQQYLQFVKVRAGEDKTFFCAFTDRAQLAKWRQFGSVELSLQDYAPLILESNDTGLLLDPYIGAGIAVTREMIQTMQMQQEMLSGLQQFMAEAEQRQAGAAAPEQAGTDRKPNVFETSKWGKNQNPRGRKK